jgi:hypothetical protein
MGDAMPGVCMPWRTAHPHRRAFIGAALVFAFLATGHCRRSSAPRRAAPGPAKSRDAQASAATIGAADAPRYQLFASAGEALREILKSGPRVVGFGEVHQKVGSAKVPSAVRRFTEQILSELAPQTSDLIVETWVTDGRCGEEETRVVKNVEKTTERPASTESEVITLLKRAKQLGVRPHILKVGCEDYQLLLSAGRVDYEKLLSVVTRHLRTKAEAVIAARSEAGPPRAGERTAQVAGDRRIVALYGGALHNDLYPLEGLEAFSYAAALRERVRGRYLEGDLYVPEFIEKDETFSKEPWFDRFRRHAVPGKVMLVERGPSSYILVFPRAR